MPSRSPAYTVTTTSPCCSLEVPGGAQPRFRKRSRDPERPPVCYASSSNTILAAAATARGLVRDAVLADASFHARIQTLLDAILLVTSELVTNGLRHGDPPVC